MKNILIIVDMQNDFITGSLGSADAVKILPHVKNKLDAARANNALVIFTRDTHPENYLETFEGVHLPVVHCVAGTSGHAITDELKAAGADIVFDKPTFGSVELCERLHALVEPDTVIELCGLCTDICVISNALMIRAHFPENTVTVDSAACAGVTQARHEAALEVMRSCQIDVK